MIKFDEQEVINLYESGMSANAISKKIGCDHHTISRRLKKNGVKLFYERKEYPMNESKKHPPYNSKGEGGRPKVWTAEKAEELAIDLENWLAQARENKKDFWWHDWCWGRELQPSRVSELAKEFPRFNEAYKMAKEWQESIIVKGALTKKLSDGFTKFYLCNNYAQNWSENKKGEEISPETVNQFLALMQQVKNGQSDRNIDESKISNDAKSE